MAHNKANGADFAEYMQQMAQLNALENLAESLDIDLEESQRVTNDMRAMLEAIPNLQNSENSRENLRQDEISNFLSTGTPRLLMPDMEENNMEINLDDVINTMKLYAEDLHKNFLLTQIQVKINKEIECLELEQYAWSLERLGKQLANMKLTSGVDHKNTELEGKLNVLCKNVNMFSQMVQTKAGLSECNSTWDPTTNAGASLNYEEIINKLISGINEVTYMLQNKKFQ